MSGLVYTHDAPRRRSRSIYQLDYPRSGHTLQGIFLCEARQIVQAVLHWDRELGIKGRTAPHREPPCECTYCRRGVARVLKGFIPCFTKQTGRRWGLVLGEECLATLLEKISHETHMRGRAFRATRGKGDTSLVVVSLTPPEFWDVPETDLPPAFDLRATVEHMHQVRGDL